LEWKTWLSANLAELDHCVDSIGATTRQEAGRSVSTDEINGLVNNENVWETWTATDSESMPPKNGAGSAVTTAVMPRNVWATTTPEDSRNTSARFSLLREEIDRQHAKLADLRRTVSLARSSSLVLLESRDATPKLTDVNGRSVRGWSVAAAEPSLSTVSDQRVMLAESQNQTQEPRLAEEGQKVPLSLKAKRGQGVGENERPSASHRGRNEGKENSSMILTQDTSSIDSSPAVFL
jgi:hypothetical protein